MKSDPDKCWLRLANGWTVSIAKERGNLCNVAAWPTANDEMVLSNKNSKADWFVFDFGKRDVSCYSLGDLQAVLNHIQAAEPPK